jgi:HPt (histidine-containing phosphotransfer) domain-containing protein
MLSRWLPGRRSQNRDTPKEVEPAPQAEDLAESEATPILDEDVVQKLIDLSPNGSDEILLKIIAAYLTSSLENMNDIDHAIVEIDIERLRHASHTLKSSSAAVGALAFSKLCAEIEAAARGGDLAGSSEKIPTLKATYEQVCNALKTMQ